MNQTTSIENSLVTCPDSLGRPGPVGHLIRSRSSNTDANRATSTWIIVSMSNFSFHILNGAGHAQSAQFFATPMRARLSAH